MKTPSQILAMRPADYETADPKREDMQAYYDALAEYIDDNPPLENVEL